MGEHKTLSSAITLLESWGACDSWPTDALPWLRSLPPDTTPEEAYNACKRGDWLLWLAGHAGVDRKIIALAACACIRAALARVDAAEVSAAIETIEAWTRDEASMEDVRAAKIKVYAANWCDYITYAHADTARRAELCAHYRDRSRMCLAAAYVAAYAVVDDVSAIDAIDAANAYAVTATQAVFVRSVIPWSVMSAALEAV